MKSTKPEGQPQKKSIFLSIQYFGLWGVTAVLLIPTLLQVKALILYTSLLMIESESFRPPGWNTGTLTGVDKCTTFLGIVIWLIVVMFAEGHLRESIAQGKFLSYAGRMLLIILSVYVSSAVILYLIG